MKETNLLRDTRNAINLELRKYVVWWMYIPVDMFPVGPISVNLNNIPHL